MGLLDRFRKLLGGSVPNPETLPRSMHEVQEAQKAQAAPGGKLDADELARRLGMSLPELQAVPIAYRKYAVPKRSGGQRTIAAPEAALKKVQRLILRRLLGKLRCHDAVTGFERGRSVVTHALPHRGRAVVIRMDIRDFFGTTPDRAVREFFSDLGWNSVSVSLLAKLCTFEGSLPQGAPTSPRLSNLVNFLMDLRLDALADTVGAVYTRYADDLTFSLASDNRDAIRGLLGSTKLIVRDFGYTLHQKRKLQIRRRHECQMVTGLVVNHRVNLPRKTRRWLRAVEHHLETGKPATLTAAQLAGWHALRGMVEKQAQAQA